MIKYLKHNYIDRKKYDQCILMDNSKLIYGLSWYLDLICPSWDVLVLNDYDAVWPLPVNSKYGIKYFYRPFAAQQLGIFSKTKIDNKTRDEFLIQVQKNSSFADVFANEGQSFSAPNVEQTSHLNYVLNISKSYQKIYEKYEHPLYLRVGELAKKMGGHGGMDFMMLYRIVECLIQGEPLDQNVYEGCHWSAVGPLSEHSVAQGGTPQAFPDFTRGKWKNTLPLSIVK